MNEQHADVQPQLDLHSPQSHLYSMTGFARESVELPSGGTVTLTLKTVNHRFLDISTRIPVELEELDVPLRSAAKQGIVRGHLDITLQIQRPGVTGTRVNMAVASEYLETLRELSRRNSVAATADLVGVLRLPGVMGGDAQSAPSLSAEDRAQVMECCGRALAALNAMRAAEGAQIAEDLRQWLKVIREANGQARALREPARAAVLQRLRERLEELIGSAADPARVLQEAALLAERSDIAEECARMDAHLVRFEEILDACGECGKKLDFLLQEMHREANTMLSKTSGMTGDALHVTTFGLDMKSAIEKCREQVQNIA